MTEPVFSMEQGSTSSAALSFHLHHVAIAHHSLYVNLTSVVDLVYSYVVQETQFCIKVLLLCLVNNVVRRRPST
jgi:hypothetical protein